MITALHIFSETRINGEWKADAAQTFEMDEANRFGWVAVRMRPVSHMQDYNLFGLLVDEVRTSWPWSMHERGFPEDASPEVIELKKSWGVGGHSHSYMTLLVEPRSQASELLRPLTHLIRGVTEAKDLKVDHEDRRVVFWFDS